MLISTITMQEAWCLLRKQRNKAPAHAGIWDLRWRYLNDVPAWLKDLVQREGGIGPVQR